MTNAVAVLLMIAITAYAIFGGADFGAGFWDLVAGGAERGDRPREVIDHSIGPVWEANHVWLIFIFVILWTGFPEAYASITLTVFVPLTLAALGDRAARLELRVPQDRLPHPRPPQLRRRLRDRRRCSCPYCLGAAAGAVASGRVPAGGVAGDPWTSWINPTSILGGVLAVVVVAYLAAVYLVRDAKRTGRRRPWRSTSVVAPSPPPWWPASWPSSGSSSCGPTPATSSTGWPAGRLPFVLLSAVCGAGVAHPPRPRRRPRRPDPRHRGRRRASSIGWGVAQWPYILPESAQGVPGRRTLRHPHRPARRRRRRRRSSCSPASSSSTPSTRRACYLRKAWPDDQRPSAGRVLSLRRIRRQNDESGGA